MTDAGMIMITGQDGQYEGIEVDLRDAFEDLRMRIRDGQAVLLVPDLWHVADFGIDPMDVEMVDPGEY